jgi:signal transduction histidine kinase
MSINALDAMARGGRLTFALEARDGKVAARIRDTGTGIPAEHLDKVWEMFFTTKARGSGIGLFVARMVVDRHRGDLAIESTGPDGTCFRLELPLAEEA